LEAADARLPLQSDCEITLEANPGAAECGAFEGYARAGVNRISFGVQSFDDGCLQRLGRIHDAGQATRAIQQAQDAGFDNLNLDLMYALPGQDLDMAQDDVAQAIALAPAHISHYQLTLEPNTVFATRPPEHMPDQDIAWDMQERCQAQLAAAGYVQYEVSAYARHGRQCAHNLNYWRFGDYLGIGAGAHGKISRIDAAMSQLHLQRRWKHKHPAHYLASAGTAQAIGGDDPIPPAQRPFEYMLNALRLCEGFALDHFETTTGLPAEVIAAPLARAQVRGWLQVGPGRVQPTPLGSRFANDVIAGFLAD
ncbi:MAG TPA: radical SAM family heme chaperone HemW, partial [Xanthomonadaceae bacterium]|nr:radical SAM family heme chaperone HemW [Xanthomonadaceae bacterium]